MTTFTSVVSTGPATAGHVPTAVEMDTWHDAMAALSEAWSSFTPVWTSTGTAPVIGNGTLEGRYLQVGKFVVYTGRMLAGSTTTFGTGSYSMSVPVNSSSTDLYVASCLTYDFSVGTAETPAVVRMNGNTTIRFYGINGQVAATVPFTFAVSDQLIWTIVYEAA